MMKLLLQGIFLIFIFTGCSVKTNVVQMPNTEIDTSQKSFVFFNSDVDDFELRYELKQMGYDIKKERRSTGVQVKSENTVKSYSEGESRYGIQTHIGHRSSQCVLNDGVYTSVSLEIIDLKTNNTMFLINGNGWTDDCFPNTGGLYREVAKRIDLIWKKDKSESTK